MWAKCISKDGNQCDHLHSMNDSEVKKNQTGITSFPGAYMIHDHLNHTWE